VLMSDSCWAGTRMAWQSHIQGPHHSGQPLLFFFFFSALAFELRVYTLSHFTSPFFLCWVFSEIGSYGTVCLDWD
jgi:hypothetical protein